MLVTIGVNFFVFISVSMRRKQYRPALAASLRPGFCRDARLIIMTMPCKIVSELPPATPWFSHPLFVPSSHIYINKIHIVHTSTYFFFLFLTKQHGAASLRSSWRSMSGTASMSMSMSTSHGQEGGGNGTDLASRSYDGSLASLAASSSKGSNRTAVAARTGKIEVRECPEVCLCHIPLCLPYSKIVRGFLVRGVLFGACYPLARATPQCVFFSSACHVRCMSYSRVCRARMRGML